MLADAPLWEGPPLTASARAERSLRSRGVDPEDVGSIIAFVVAHGGSVEFFPHAGAAHDAMYPARGVVMTRMTLRGETRDYGGQLPYPLWHSLVRIWDRVLRQAHERATEAQVDAAMPDGDPDMIGHA